jgi:hypothetical protein
MVPEKCALPQKVRTSALSETIAPYIKAEMLSELLLANNAIVYANFAKSSRVSFEH